MSEFSVYVVNPKSKSKSKKKPGKKRPKKKAARRKPEKAPTMAKKKRARRKPAAKRRNTHTPTPARRRAPARRSNPAKKKRRRRRNPVLGLGLGSVFGELKPAIQRLAGTLATAWAVRQFGKSGGLFGQAHTSPMMGESWGWSQYAIAGAVAMWGPKLLGKFINAKEFQRGSVDLIVQKLVWTEGIARSDWAVKQFGTGDVGYDSGSGQMYMQQGDSWSAMQGLVEASPLDGLVEASPLDGGYGAGYGHLLPANVPHATAVAGRNLGSGYTTNYHAAFSR